MNCLGSVCLPDAGPCAGSLGAGVQRRPLTRAAPRRTPPVLHPPSGAKVPGAPRRFDTTGIVVVRCANLVCRMLGGKLEAVATFTGAANDAIVDLPSHARKEAGYLNEREAKE